MLVDAAFDDAQVDKLSVFGKSITPVMDGAAASIKS
jgi:hypothetical protein